MIVKDDIDERTKMYREIMDQLLVGVESASIEDHEEPFRGWFKKNNILLEDIEKLKNDNNDRSKISAFLLETQYIEFKIIDLLQELQLVVNTDPNILTFNGKKNPKELYELPLGALSDELFKYEADFLKKLKPMIKDLNTKRIRFAHYLFTSVEGIDALIKEAQEGLGQNDKILEELCTALEYIKNNTWCGQMYERKRVKSLKDIKHK